MGPAKGAGQARASLGCRLGNPAAPGLLGRRTQALPGGSEPPSLRLWSSARARPLPGSLFQSMRPKLLPYAQRGARGCLGEQGPPAGRLSLSSASHICTRGDTHTPPGPQRWYFLSPPPPKKKTVFASVFAGGR